MTLNAKSLLSRLNKVRALEGLDPTEDGGEEREPNNYYLVDTITHEVVKQLSDDVNQEWNDLTSDPESTHLTILYKDQDGEWKETNNDGPLPESSTFEVLESGEELTHFPFQPGAKVRLKYGKTGTFIMRKDNYAIVEVDGEQRQVLCKNVTAL